MPSSKTRGLSFASAGAATPGHLSGEVLKLRTKSNMTHVPYNGAGPALNDILGGHVDMFFSGFPAAVPHVKAGTMKLLAVSTAKRSSVAPDVPTVAEASGIKDFNIALWQGFFAPRGTPPEIVRRLHAEINKLLVQPEVKSKLLAAGAEVTTISTERVRRLRESGKRKISSDHQGRRPETGVSAATAKQEMGETNVMTFPRRTFLRLAASAVALPTLARFAHAQAYPSRPVRIVVGFAPGGATDILARIAGQWLSTRLGQQFIVENRPGANGNLATEGIVNASADGHSLLMIAPANTINATLFDNLNFRFIRDIAPVAGMLRTFYVMVVNPSFPARTVPEFIAYAKANRGKISYASAGSGTPQHVVGRAVQDADRR